MSWSRSCCCAVYLALTNDLGQFTGLNQFVKVAGDYRFLPSFLHIAVYLALWLAILVTLTLAVAVVLRGRMPRRLAAAFRFLYYLPGALAGVASVLVRLFMLDPSVSPASTLLRAFGVKWTYVINVTGNKINLTVNGSKTSYTIPSSFNPYRQYFKAGSYNQSSSDSTTNGAKVKFYALTVSHS